jgi:hypothetical protein
VVELVECVHELADLGLGFGGADDRERVIEGRERLAERGLVSVGRAGRLSPPFGDLLDGGVVAGGGAGGPPRVRPGEGAACVAKAGVAYGDLQPGGSA